MFPTNRRIAPPPDAGHAEEVAVTRDRQPPRSPRPAPWNRSGSGLSFYKLFRASVISNLGDGVAQIAYPWLASAVTRNPILVALGVVAQRLPWLVFTLPAA